MATFEKLDGSKVKLTIQVKADVFEDAMQKAYIKCLEPRKNCLL